MLPVSSSKTSDQGPLTGVHVFLGPEHHASTSRTTWNQPSRLNLPDPNVSTLSGLSAVVDSSLLKTPYHRFRLLSPLPGSGVEAAAIFIDHLISFYSFPTSREIKGRQVCFPSRREYVVAATCTVHRIRPVPPLLSTPNRLAVATCDGLCAADRFDGTNLRNFIREPSGGTRNRFGAPGVWLF